MKFLTHCIIFSLGFSAMAEGSNKLRGRQRGLRNNDDFLPSTMMSSMRRTEEYKTLTLSWSVYISGDGGHCDSDVNCHSRLCRNEICVADDLQNGEYCGYDEQCLSGSCDDVCEGAYLSDGEVCTDDDQCFSGFCEQAAGETESTCEGAYLSDGEVCTDDDQCLSGICFQAETAQYAVCSSYLSDGEVCTGDDQCSSGLCRYDTCIATNLQNGEYCGFNEQCLSGMCDDMCV